MACELPPHNLREVALACQLVLQGETSLAKIRDVLPAPDFAGGGQLINPEVMSIIYETGRGSLRLRARWQIEPLAKGQWRVVIYELPQGSSTAKIMAEIESLLNPQPKAGKKALTQEQAGLKAALANLLETMRDESDGQHPIRLVLEPRSRTVTSDELMTFLLAHTGLETNVPVNMTAINDDGNPRQTSLVSLLSQWAAFRVDAFQRQCRYEHRKASERVHILEGRLLVLLHIDEVIAVIRQSDEPKTELMARFALTDIQAEDILEIRLRQLARLEYLKIEQELNKLREKLAELAKLLGDEGYLRHTLVEQVQADAERFGDARRTLIQTADVVTRSDATNVADEAVTVIVSKQGFVRTRLGKVDDVNALPFKAGDGLLELFETRTVEWLFVLDSGGRIYTVAVSQLPGGKGDGMPITALIDLPAGVKPMGFACGNLQTQFVVASSGGKGFVCSGADLFSNRKAGKDCLILASAQDKPFFIAVPACSPESTPYLLLLSTESHGLAYPLSEVRELAKGTGVILVAGGISDLGCVCALNEKVTLGKYKVTADKLLGKRAGKGIDLGRKRKTTDSH
jgi:topoisomerase-4 subunit A